MSGLLASTWANVLISPGSKNDRYTPPASFRRAGSPFHSECRSIAVHHRPTRVKHVADINVEKAARPIAPRSSAGIPRVHLADGGSPAQHGASASARIRPWTVLLRPGGGGKPEE